MMNTVPSGSFLVKAGVWVNKYFRNVDNTFLNLALNFSES